ncbi:lipid storage droplets surface-binding protein 1-like [Athalia rosae]|uniref:lipid storage droplets surface-binding protein 1-like n=1 Tax=Athalia rosae TaxID=37344 RepID=UPI0020334439|nr:lipid storage droplets surface-binding protein 1-like [Athalia rosae]
MTRSNLRYKPPEISQFESVARISSLPIVESGIHIAGNVYDKIKRSNSLVSWSLDTAEQSLAAATASAKPALLVFNGPIATIDQLLCRGINIVEDRVPALNLPPQLMYFNTREFVRKKFVKPVLMRAGSVKQMGSDAADLAADRLDGALTVAEEYVDRYLPPDPTDKATDVNSDPNPTEGVSKTARTIHHGARFSRKLQRRLTRRTVAEARALKEQGTECIHVLLYVVEIIATDPKLALRKACELWATLSLPEPENQARPATLEQLLVLLTRESARRVVHLVNGAAAVASRAPRKLARILVRTSHQLLDALAATLKMLIVTDNRKQTVSQISVVRAAILRLGSTTDLVLEQFAAFLAGRPATGKAVNNQNRQQNHNNHVLVTTDVLANESSRMASETVRLPQIELFNRVMGLPIIELAFTKSASTYMRVKDSHQLVHWALSNAEASLSSATRQAVPIAAPIAKRLENSIQLVDHTLCWGLDKIEEKVPIVKEKPETILESAFTLAVQTVQPAVSKIAYANELLSSQAACLKTLSWNKANDILGTQFGTAALQGLDSTAAIADKLIDHYFPAFEAEENVSAPVSAEEDKLLHTVQTVGRLSNKAARRVYGSVRQHIKTINTDDLKEYVSNIVQILHLAQYLHAINEKVQSLAGPKDQDRNKTQS